jgi:hypothetical protein
MSVVPALDGRVWFLDSASYPEWIRHLALSTTTARRDLLRDLLSDLLRDLLRNLGATGHGHLVGPRREHGHVEENTNHHQRPADRRSPTRV